MKPSARTSKRVFAWCVLIFLVISGAFSVIVAAQPQRGLKIGDGKDVQSKTATIKDEQGKEVILYRESYALLIGMNDYTNGWPDLPGVERDVQEIKTILETQGFTVVVKMNLDRNALDQAFTDFINRYGQKPDNRLVLYFAGHGHTLKLTYGEEMGYIVPVDAPVPSRDQEGFLVKALDMQMIEVYAKRIQSKHALFVFDSCFSGSLFVLSRAVPENISYKTSQPVRQFITSGSANESVPDQSIFREQFIRALQGEADSNQDGYVTGAELGEFLQTTVVNYSHNAQHPQYGKIRNPNLDKGDCVFALPVMPTSTPAAERPPEEQFTLDDLKVKVEWQAYLKKLEAAFAEVTEYEKQDGSAEDKIAAWERFLQFAAKDNPSSARDDELRNLAQERLAYWQKNVRPIATVTPQPPQPKVTPTPIPSTEEPGVVRLRSQPLTVSEKEAHQHFNLDNWGPRTYIENDFEVQGEVAIDHATGLIWQKSGSEKKLTYQEAQAYIEKLNRERFDGYSDWRLPTVDELLSLMKHDEQSNWLYIDPIFDSTQTGCWSADKHSVEWVWIVDFDRRGSVGWSLLNGGIQYVRCVRS